MSRPDLLFRIEPMTVADIPAVLAVERASYSMTWPRKAYDYELKQNELAHYFVLRFLGQPPQDSAENPGQLKNNAGRGQQPVLSRPAATIGLGGFWLMAGQIHISTVAVHPDWRGLGLGEWLLVTLLEAGRLLGAESATLEVRPSNQAARTLYRKYEFQEVGRRSRYYRDDNEDALILTTPRLASSDYQEMFQQRQAALVDRLAKIAVDKSEPFD